MTEKKIVQIVYAKFGKPSSLRDDLVQTQKQRLKMPRPKMAFESPSE